MLTKNRLLAGFFMPVVWGLTRYHQIIAVN